MPAGAYRRGVAPTANPRLVERRTLLVGAAAISAIAIFMIVVWTSSDEPLRTTADAALISAVGDDPMDATDTTDTEPSRPASDTMATSTSGPSPTGAPPPSTTTASPTSTTMPLDLLPTLVEGDTGIETLLLQRMLNVVTGADLTADGVYGPATVAAVNAFQRFFGLPTTGEADHETRMLLKLIDGGRSNALTSWPLPTIGDGGANGCQVAVIGDSLMAGAQGVHTDRLTEIGCASAVDGVGGRSLALGWQCRVLQPDGRRPLLLLAAPEPGNATCAPSGLELLKMWSEAAALGDAVVLALGTNDATLFAEQRWIQHWEQALAFVGGRPLLALTTQGRPGSLVAPAQAEYSEALRLWCATKPNCVLADWGLTMAANDAASYVDSVHLTTAATDARAIFISDVVAALLSGEPIPNPVPLPTPTTTMPPATTTSTSTTSPTSTTTTSTTAPSTTSSSTTTSTTSSTTITDPSVG